MFINPKTFLTLHVLNVQGEVSTQVLRSSLPWASEIDQAGYMRALLSMAGQAYRLIEIESTGKAKLAPEGARVLEVTYDRMRAILYLAQNPLSGESLVEILPKLQGQQGYAWARSLRHECVLELVACATSLSFAHISAHRVRGRSLFITELGTAWLRKTEQKVPLAA
jgi:hypothetical protein